MSDIFEVPDIFNAAQFMVDRHIDEGRSGNIAIYFNDQEITYGQLSSMVNRTGNALKNLGVEIENRVMILLPDCPEFLYSYLGAMKIGAVPVPVNTLASLNDYLYFLNNSRAKVLITSHDMFSKLEAFSNDFKYLKHIVTVNSPNTSVLNFEKLLSDSPDILDAAETSKDDVAFWMYTSGTTGFPKGVVHLHHDVVYYMYPVCKEILNITKEDVIFSTSKIFFSYGRNNSIETPLLNGAGVVLFSDWPDPQNTMQIVKRYKPTLFFSVPTFYAAILREIEKSNLEWDLSSVRLCLSAGESLPKNIFDQWGEKFGHKILDIVGSTDVGGEYLGNKLHDFKPGSSGKLLSGFEGQLRDTDGQEVLPGQVGTLWLSNDGIADRYWNNHKRSKEVFAGTWFNTGDQFYQDSDGFFWYQGREDDMLKVSGQWVSYLEIERILQDHPAVSESAVIGAPDAAGLIRIKAFVIPKETYQVSSELEKELIDYVRDKTAHFKAPRWIEFVEAFPRTATGKLQRHKLH